MPDKIEKLRATLSELHEELQSLDQADPTVHGLLSQAVAELNEAIEKHGPALPGSLDQRESASILGRLRDAVAHYQESHPALAASVGSVIDVLGRMGL